MDEATSALELTENDIPGTIFTRTVGKCYCAFPEVVAPLPRYPRPVVMEKSQVDRKVRSRTCM